MQLPLKTIYLCVLLCSVLNTQNALAKTTPNSASDLLEKAQSLEKKDPILSSKYAIEAITQAKTHEETAIIAKSHELLGELAKTAKSYTRSAKHFLSAANDYKHIKNHKKHVQTTIYYGEMSFLDNHFDVGFKAINEAISLSERFKYADLKAKAITILGDGYYHAKDYDNAIKYYREALDYYSENIDTKVKYLAPLYRRLSRPFKKKKDYATSMVYLEKSLPLYKKLKDTKNMAQVLDNLATAARKQGHYIDALDFALKSLEQQKKINNDERLAKTFLNVAIIYRAIGSYDKALRYVNQAYELHKKNNDINGIAVTSNETGLIFTQLKQYNNANQYYQKTVNLPTKEVKDEYRAVAFREISRIELNEGNYKKAMTMARDAADIYTDIKNVDKNASVSRIIGDIYMAKNNKDKAIIYYKKSIDQARKAKSEKKESDALNLLGTALMTQDIKKSIDILKSSLILSKKINNKSVLLKNYKSLKKAETIRLDYKKALEYSNLELDLSNKIHIKNAANGLENMKLVVDSQKKEIELEELKEQAEFDEINIKKKSSELEIIRQANKIKTLELAKNRYTRSALFIFLILTLGFLALLFYCYFQSKKMNRLLDKKYSILERENENKDRLFSIIAHDVRSPIMSIIGLCGLVKQDFDNYDKAKLYHTIHQIDQSSHNTLSLLNTLLEWAASQFINSEINISKIALLQLCQQVKSEVKSIAHLKEIDITIDVDSALHAKADRNMIATSLRNILSNAIKYTPPKGNITVSAKRMDDQIALSIKDEGTGIEPDKLNDLFNRKKNQSTTGTNGEQGFGLGLSLCYDLIQKNQGQINVNSIIGQGSTFTISLPTAPM